MKKRKARRKSKKRGFAKYHVGIARLYCKSNEWLDRSQRKGDHADKMALKYWEAAENFKREPAPDFLNAKIVETSERR